MQTQRFQVPDPQFVQLLHWCPGRLQSFRLVQPGWQQQSQHRLLPSTQQFPPLPQRPEEYGRFLQFWWQPEGGLPQQLHRGATCCWQAVWLAAA
jgi:hypothetical protein